jgi:hypothetical protein
VQHKARGLNKGSGALAKVAAGKSINRGRERACAFFTLGCRAWIIENTATRAAAVYLFLRATAAAAQTEHALEIKVLPLCALKHTYTLSLSLSLARRRRHSTQSGRESIKRTKVEKSACGGVSRHSPSDGPPTAAFLTHRTRSHPFALTHRRSRQLTRKSELNTPNKADYPRMFS